MKYWIPLFFEPIEQLQELAVAVEECGFDGVALMDHLTLPVGYEALHTMESGQDFYRNLGERGYFYDALVTVPALAAVTTTLRFTTWVYVLGMRHPVPVAKQVATAAILSGYRFAFGVGVGWLKEEIEACGFDYHTRGRRVDEMLTIMNDFWDDGYCEFHGEFFDIPPTTMFPVPEQRIPVWVGGDVDASVRRAVANDGYLPMWSYEDSLGRIGKALEGARGRSSDAPEFEVMAAAPRRPFQDVDPATIEEMAERGVTSLFLAGWPMDATAESPVNSGTVAEKRAHLERLAEQLGLAARA